MERPAESGWHMKLGFLISRISVKYLRRSLEHYHLNMLKRFDNNVFKACLPELKRRQEEFGVLPSEYDLKPNF